MFRKLGKVWRRVDGSIRSDWATHPVTGTVTTVLILLTGGIGSLYSSEIRAAFPFDPVPLPVGSWQWPAFFFWLVALTAAVLFFCQQHARRRIEGRLVDRFETLLRTQPPEGFLRRLADQITEADKVVDQVDEVLRDAGSTDAGARLAGQRAAVQAMLRWIAGLAHVYDHERHGVRYAANVMWLLPRAQADWPDGLDDGVVGRVLFATPALSPRRLPATLWLDPNLSASAGTEGADKNATALVLPVACGPRDENAYGHLLPGAPHAAATGQTWLTLNMDDLMTWCGDQPGLDHLRVEEMKRYFIENGDVRRAVRSFVSVPIYELVDGRVDRQGYPLAVLNIHASAEGLLRGKAEAVEQFDLAMRPFYLFLSKLLAPMKDQRTRATLPVAA